MLRSARGCTRAMVALALALSTGVVVAVGSGQGAARPPIEAAVTVNAKRVLHRTGQLFLSLQIDPSALVQAQDESRWSSGRVLAMARALAPAYLQVAGPGTDGMHLASPGSSHGGNVTEADWLLLTRFCSAAGLRATVAVPASARLQGAWDPRPSLPLMGLAASLGCDLTFHLGYEPQECEYLQPEDGAVAAVAGAAAAGAQAGRDALALRRLLDAFPQCAQRARFLALDITRVASSADAAWARAALEQAAHAANALSWHTAMWAAAENGGGLGPKARPRPVEQLIAERDFLLRMLPRHAPPRHPPLWIGEPWSEAKGAESAGPWEVALRWARRLGIAARLGAAVATHVFDPQTLFEPSPDYWVSLAHHRLVGDGVFDVRVAGGPRRLDVFCRCATRPAGALVIMAVNGGRARARLNIKGLASSLMAGSDGGTAQQILQYMLTYRDGQTLLNGRPLTLRAGDSLPPLQPRSLTSPSPASGVHAPPLALAVPPRAIAFWVLPGAGGRLCAAPSQNAFSGAGALSHVANAQQNDYQNDGEDEAEEAAGENQQSIIGRRRKMSGARAALQRLRGASDGATHTADYDEEYDYFDESRSQKRPDTEAASEAEEASRVSKDVGGSSSAEAVWNIAQASLLADRRATVGVAGGADDGDDMGDDDDDIDGDDEGTTETAGDDEGPPEMPPPLPSARQKYLKNMFVNAITKGPDPQEQKHRVRRAVDGPPPGSSFVMAAASPGLSGVAARRPLKRHLKLEDRLEKWRHPRRATKARDPEEEKMESIFGQQPPDGAAEGLNLKGGGEEEAFPVGDVFVEEGKPESSMERNKDYDYVEEDSEELREMRRQARGRGRGRRRRQRVDDAAAAAAFTGENHITEYEHSELFEQLNVTRASKDLPGKAPCTHELHEAVALAPSTQSTTDSPSTTTDPDTEESASESKEKSKEKPKLVRQEDDKKSCEKKMSREEAGKQLASYLEHTRTARPSEEMEDYGELDDARDYSSEDSSLDFEEALDNLSDSDDNWGSNLASCDAEWPLSGKKKQSVCPA